MSKKKHIIKHLKQNIEKSDLSELETAIINTLWYKNIFRYPLSFFEISHFLIGSKPDSHSQLKTEINNLFRKDLIEFHNGKYHLKHMKDTGWIIRQKDSQQYLQKAQEIVNKLKAIPWLKMISVTGSVSALNAAKSDDIDIFIVTQRNRLWITRLFVTLYLKVLKQYRTDVDYAGKICPNIYMSENNLEWPKERQNLYSAQEIIMMHPIFDRGETYLEFLEKNSWIKSFFPNFEWSSNSLSTRTNKSSRFMDVLEILFEISQRIYMKSKKTTEVTKKELIHFNKVDWSITTLEQYKEIEIITKNKTS